MKKYMKKYASNTGYSISCCLGIEKEVDSAVVATVEFAKEISYATVNKILSHMTGKEEIHFMIDGYVKGEIPDYQMSAFLMATYFNNMNDDELFAFTKSANWAMSSQK